MSCVDDGMLVNMKTIATNMARRLEVTDPKTEFGFIVMGSNYTPKVSYKWLQVVNVETLMPQVIVIKTSS